MDGLRLGRKEREALRERWLLRAGQAFERMFAAANQDQLVTFTEREDLAVDLGKELSAFLLEEHVGADVQARPAERRPPGCPKCGQPGARKGEAKAALAERELATRAGKVKVRREQWRCRKCRILFFSARPQAEAGDGGVQPAADREGGAAGGEGGVVP